MLSQQSIISFLKILFTGKQDQYSPDTIVEAIRFVFQNQKDFALPISLIAFFLAYALWNHADNSVVIAWLAVSVVIRLFSYWQANYFLQRQFGYPEILK